MISLIRLAQIIHDNETYPQRALIVACEEIKLQQENEKLVRENKQLSDDLIWYAGLYKEVLKANNALLKQFDNIETEHRIKLQ